MINYSNKAHMKKYITKIVASFLTSKNHLFQEKFIDSWNKTKCYTKM